jgi:hypothetical protein
VIACEPHGVSHTHTRTHPQKHTHTSPYPIKSVEITKTPAFVVLKDLFHCPIENAYALFPASAGWETARQVFKKYESN